MKFTKNSLGYCFLFVVLVIAVFTFLWWQGELSSPFFFAFLAAGIITSTNFILGVLSIKFGLKKRLNIFLILFLGGMVFRLFLMLFEVFICLKFLELRPNSFIFSVFIFYIFYQIIEISYVIYQNK